MGYFRQILFKRVNIDLDFIQRGNPLNPVCNLRALQGLDYIPHCLAVSL